MEPVTDVLVGRAREPVGLRVMVALSIGLHLIGAVVLVAMPETWGGRRDEEPKTVMTISLGSAPGPRTGGANPMGGRPVQAVAPTPAEPEPRPEAARPPAARTPEMTVPTPDAKKASRPAEPAPPVKAAPDDATGRKPIFGEQERFGAAAADTGGVGFGGLTTGGGGGTAGGYLDVGNFCCPDYLMTMQRLIQQRWNSRQMLAGSATLKFTILRTGRVTNVAVEKSSGYVALDIAAQRALLTSQLPPLPLAFTEDSLTVHLIFDYQR